MAFCVADQESVRVLVAVVALSQQVHHNLEFYAPTLSRLA